MLQASKGGGFPAPPREGSGMAKFGDGLFERGTGVTGDKTGVGGFACECTVFVLKKICLKLVNFYPFFHFTQIKLDYNLREMP